MSKKSKDFLRPSAESGNVEVSLEVLAQYPSLARLCESRDGEKVNKMRSGLNNATKDLDHIIRTGTPEQAASASKALSAIVVTLEFLDSMGKTELQ